MGKRAKVEREKKEKESGWEREKGLKKPVAAFWAAGWFFPPSNSPFFGQHLCVLPAKAVP